MTSFTYINWHKIILHSKFLSTHMVTDAYFEHLLCSACYQKPNLGSTCTEHFPLKTNYPCQNIMLLLCETSTKKENTQNEYENVAVTKWQLVYNFLFLNIKQHSTIEFSTHKNRRLFYLLYENCRSLSNCRSTGMFLNCLVRALTTNWTCPKNFIHIYEYSPGV